MPSLSPNSYKREELDIRYIEELFDGIKMKDLTPALLSTRSPSMGLSHSKEEKPPSTSRPFGQG